MMFLKLVVVASFSSMIAVCSASNEVINDLLHNHASRPCRSLNFDSITAGNRQQTISGIDGALGAIANGNDVYVTGYNDRNVYRFNSQEGDGVQILETQSVVGTPFYLDINDGFLYATSYTANSVFRKPLIGGEFTNVLSVDRPAGIKWSQDGTRLFVGQVDKVSVFNKDLELIDTFNYCEGSVIPREIGFDLNGNIRISTYAKEFCTFNKDSYELLARESLPIASTVYSEGYLQHCDGTIILADRTGRLHFLDKNYQTLRTVDGYGSLGDVALTTDGTLYVTDFQRRAIYLYSLYDSADDNQ